jgi:hypothetical protein
MQYGITIICVEVNPALCRSEGDGLMRLLHSGLGHTKPLIRSQWHADHRGSIEGRR